MNLNKNPLTDAGARECAQARVNRRHNTRQRDTPASATLRRALRACGAQSAARGGTCAGRSCPSRAGVGLRPAPLLGGVAPPPGLPARSLARPGPPAPPSPFAPLRVASAPPRPVPGAPFRRPVSAPRLLAASAPVAVVLGPGASPPPFPRPEASPFPPALFALASGWLSPSAHRRPRPPPLFNRL